MRRVSQSTRSGSATAQTEATPLAFSALILSFYLPAVLLAFSLGLVSPVLPLYAKSFDVSYGLVGLVSGGAALGMLIGDLPSGFVVRRLGQKRALLLGVGCHIASTVALYWARSIPEVIVYRLLSGLGQAGYAQVALVESDTDMPTIVTHGFLPLARVRDQDLAALVFHVCSLADALEKRIFGGDFQ